MLDKKLTELTGQTFLKRWSLRKDLVQRGRKNCGAFEKVLWKPTTCGHIYEKN